MLQTISGGGAFTRQNIADINANFLAVQGRVPDLWVRPQYGQPTNPGTFDKPFDTMAACSRYIKPGLVIGLQGVLKEQFTAPIVNDVTIVGYNSNYPRQATTSGTPNGGGATWLSPTSATASLLKIQGQSWRVENIYFNNSCTTATTAGVELVGGGDPPLTADAGGTTVVGCTFTGEANGLYLNAYPGFLQILNNKFFLFDSSGDCGIKAGGVGGTGWGTVVRGNTFTANLNHIIAGAWGWEVDHNRFAYIDATVTATTQINFTGGKDNSVHNNYFDLPYSTAGITAMFTLGTNDRWYFNEFATAVTTTIYSFGAPSS